MLTSVLPGRSVMSMQCVIIPKDHTVVLVRKDIMGTDKIAQVKLILFKCIVRL